MKVIALYLLLAANIAFADVATYQANDCKLSLPAGYEISNQNGNIVIMYPKRRMHDVIEIGNLPSPYPKYAGHKKASEEQHNKIKVQFYSDEEPKEPYNLTVIITPSQYIRIDWRPGKEFVNKVVQSCIETQK